jgi:phosphoglycerol transferase
MKKIENIKLMMISFVAMLSVGCSDGGYYGSINFSESQIKQIESSENLSGAEPWGRWSDGSPLKIKLSEALPKNFKMLITVTQSFGNNLNQPIEVVVSNVSNTFIGPSSKSTISLEYKNVEPNSRVILIKIPHPASPKDLGISSDLRRLGIGISGIEIAPISN